MCYFEIDSDSSRDSAREYEYCSTGTVSKTVVKRGHEAHLSQHWYSLSEGRDNTIRADPD